MPFNTIPGEFECLSEWNPLWKVLFWRTQQDLILYDWHLEEHTSALLSPSRPDALAGPNVLRILQLNMSCLLSNYSHLYCDLLQDANFSVYAYIYMVRSTKYEKLSGHVCSAAVRCSMHCSILHSLLENIFSESSYSAPQVLKVDFRHTTWHSVSHRVGKVERKICGMLIVEEGLALRDVDRSGNKT